MTDSELFETLPTVKDFNELLNLEPSEINIRDLYFSLTNTLECRCNLFGHRVFSVDDSSIDYFVKFYSYVLRAIYDKNLPLEVSPTELYFGDDVPFSVNKLSQNIRVKLSDNVGLRMRFPAQTTSVFPFRQTITMIDSNDEAVYEHYIEGRGLIFDIRQNDLLYSFKDRVMNELSENIKCFLLMNGFTL